MARLRRRWRILKWVGAGASVVLLAVWVASAFLYFGAVFPSGWKIAVGYGRVSVSSSDDLTSLSVVAGWRIDRNQSPGLRFWFPEYRTYFGVHEVLVPGWIPFLLVAIPTGLLWWRDRRRIPPGHCQKCGYDLTGNLSGVCSECGEPVAGQTVSADSKADALVGHSRSATES